jgi:hypothetical protein
LGLPVLVEFVKIELRRIAFGVPPHS